MLLNNPSSWPASALVSCEKLSFASTPAPSRVPVSVRLFGLDVVNDSADAVLNWMFTDDTAPRRVHFVNAHCINVMAKDPAYFRALTRAGSVVLPDGAGIELALKLQGKRLVENLNGTDFVPRLAQRAAREGRSIFLLGARPGTAEKAARRLQDLAPGLIIAGVRDGFEGARDPQATIAAINASDADILLVAKGVPLQDIWLAEHSEALQPRLALGVGACFDFLAGNVSRAPEGLRRMRGEWIWRLMQEPRRLAMRYLVGNPVFVVRAVRAAAAAADRGAVAQRALDIALASVALLMLSPVLIGAALAVRLSSPGAVLFRQVRIGRDGRPFEMFKFRSMFTDAEARRAALLAQSDRHGICFKSRHDPRITPVGRVLRRFSIDELPQILNVLRGDMSMVGPRPALPSEVAAYPERALGRLATRPGITGLWQVSGRAEIGFDKMIDMDLAYVRSRSVLLDLVLLAMTFRAVFGGRGAY